MSILKQPPPNEADVIFNRANIALARSQRLVASWLPAKTEEETSASREGKTEDEDDDKIFTAVPERLGLGAPIPAKPGFAADGSLTNSNNNIKLNDKLRQRLLGKNAKKFLQQQQQQQQRQANKSGTSSAPGENAVGHNDDDDDEDEEEGRTSLGKSRKPNSKKRKIKSTDAEMVPDEDNNNNNHDAEINSANGANDVDDENGDIKQIPTVVPVPSSSSSSKRKKAATGSYLDELLDRKKKKKKKAANE
ncbi:hypothetical protein UA08_02697 [Talaromyces atroroseus]|uniref:Uncharacterized protein n=1 Tax=Talaromyces atroroseus TaxID=1441469 RepID=A0A225B5B3_TALAT|nr:hypothetical protein UA08_02697 [Talaromyces atroroseus]OKL62466.1 hypothetical protein UA08_02697 [Talaromyces atroroseus]